MKRLLYILLALPLLIGCQGKKKATGDAMPVPEVSVAHPLVKDITLTKRLPGLFNHRTDGKPRSTSQRHFTISFLYTRKPGQKGTITIRHRTHYL